METRTFSGYRVDRNGYVFPDNTSANDLSARKFESALPMSLSQDDTYRISVPAGNIAGIQLNVEEQLDPDVFWGQHTIIDPKTGEIRKAVKADYIALASKVPEVYKQLESGKTLEEVLEDPELHDAAYQYFSEQNVIRASSDANNEYIQMGGYGRHRVLAAREVGTEIPVKVISVYPTPEQTIEFDNEIDFW